MVTNTKVRLSFLTSVGLVASVGLGFFLLGVLGNASRAIGWMFFSASIAIMLYPAVHFLNRYIPKAFAVILLILFVIGLVVVPVYSVVEDVNAQARKLERTLPQRAIDLETDGRFAENFREFRLEERTRDAIRYIPNLIAGGTDEERISANANRAIAVIVGGVLMIFFLLYGDRLVKGALSVVKDDQRRDRLDYLLRHAFSRCTRFGWSQIVLSISAGLFTYLICRINNIPAAGLLATWAAVWNIVPVFGVVIGTIPIVVLAGAQSLRLAVILLILFIVYEIIESFARFRLLGPYALRMDLIVTIFIVFGGIELYGLGGALSGLVIATFLHAFASELASENPV